MHTLPRRWATRANVWVAVRFNPKLQAFKVSRETWNWGRNFTPLQKMIPSTARMANDKSTASGSWTVAGTLTESGALNLNTSPTSRKSTPV